jgi:hypothetical protein
MRRDIQEEWIWTDHCQLGRRLTDIANQAMGAPELDILPSQGVFADVLPEASYRVRA